MMQISNREPTNDDVHEFLILVQRMCPTLEARHAFNRLARDAADNNASNSEIVALLAFRLLDGLRHGNWPV